ncbi:MAG: diguanylate cyclase [Pseudomonadota bacterium]
MIKTAVIEDSRAVAALYTAYLRETEFEVHCFGSTPQEVDRLLIEKGFQVVITPSYPKFQSGPEIAAHIKSDPDLASSMFILSTTMQKGELKSDWDFRDIDGIIVKPFQKEDLQKALHDLYYAYKRPSRSTPLALVVDDSNAVRKVLSSFLKSMDFDVITAPDGRQGLTMALESRPNLILTDVEMPVMDGLELCRRVTLEPTIKNTPVIVISGSMDDQQFSRAFNAGAIDFLQKPVSQSDLASVIESVSVRDHTAPAGTALVLSNDTTLNTIFIKVLKLLNFHINICSTPQELETYLYVSIPNIIILDLSDLENRLDHCMQVRNLARKSSPVIIAVADEGDRNTMVQCFKYGASEFITKPFGRDELKARIENHIKMKRLQDELIQKNRILESLAYKDKLTGLMNRRYFDETLSKELSRADKDGLPLSFMMMDLDNFKQVNDRYGHDIGDVVLKEIAAILMSRVDDSGIVCRYGGEEFCVIFPGKTLSEAMKKGEDIRRSCQANTISAHKIRQTVSGGIACYPETSSLESLVIDADNFLYKAKRAGKNKIVSSR